MPNEVHYLVQRSRNGDFRAGMEAAMHPDATATELEELSHNPLAETREAVARHPSTDDETHRRLCYDADVRVAAAVASRLDLDDELRHALALRAEADYTVLRGAQRAAIIDLCLALADNEATGLPEVKRLLKRLPTTLFARRLASQTARLDIQELLLDHPKATVRQELACNDELDDELIEPLLNDSNAKVAECARKRLVETVGEDEATFAPAYTQAKMADGNERAGTHEDDSALLAGDEAALTQARDFIRNRLPKTGMVIHTGCAAGELTASLATARADAILAIDIAPAMLTATRKRCGDASRVLCLQHDLRRGLPVCESGAAAVVLGGVTAALPDPESFIRSCREALIENGCLLGILPCLAEDDKMHRLFAEVASEFGVYLQTFSEMSVMLATSGLVVEHLSPTCLPRPAETDKDVAAKLGSPFWRELLGEAEAAGCALDEVTLGVMEVHARHVSF